MPTVAPSLMPTAKASKPIKKPGGRRAEIKTDVLRHALEVLQQFDWCVFEALEDGGLDNADLKQLCLYKELHMPASATRIRMLKGLYQRGLFAKERGEGPQQTRISELAVQASLQEGQAGPSTHLLPIQYPDGVPPGFTKVYAASSAGKDVCSYRPPHGANGARRPKVSSRIAAWRLYWEDNGITPPTAPAAAAPAAADAPPAAPADEERSAREEADEVEDE